MLPKFEMTLILMNYYCQSTNDLKILKFVNYFLVHELHDVNLRNYWLLKTQQKEIGCSKLLHFFADDVAVVVEDKPNARAGEIFLQFLQYLLCLEVEQNPDVILQSHFIMLKKSCAIKISQWLLYYFITNCVTNNEYTWQRWRRDVFFGMLSVLTLWSLMTGCCRIIIGQAVSNVIYLSSRSRARVGTFFAMNHIWKIVSALRR